VEVERLYRLVGGHPDLVRRGLHAMSAGGLDIASVERETEHDEGIFGDHLRRMLVLLVKDPELGEVVRIVLRGGPSPTRESFHRLRSAGVLAGEAAAAARVRCPLYAIYLERHLL
jgi:hypothetical protein